MSFEHRDGFTAATETGYRDAKKAGYRFWGDQGESLPKMPGTVPLNLYYSAKRRDNFSTFAFWERGCPGGRICFVRVQGYVYPKARKGAVPLNFGAGQHDGPTIHHNQSWSSVIFKETAFHEAGIEGYVLKAPGSRGKGKKRARNSSNRQKKEGAGPRFRQIPQQGEERRR